MKKRNTINNIVKVALSLMLGGAILYWMYRGFDFSFPSPSAYWLRLSVAGVGSRLWSLSGRSHAPRCRSTVFLCPMP